MATGARKRMLAKRKDKIDEIAAALREWQTAKGAGAVAEEDAWQALQEACRELADFDSSD